MRICQSDSLCIRSIYTRGVALSWNKPDLTATSSTTLFIKIDVVLEGVGFHLVDLEAM